MKKAIKSIIIVVLLVLFLHPSSHAEQANRVIPGGEFIVLFPLPVREYAQPAGTVSGQWSAVGDQ
ncbi:MAG: hypothetical protein AB1611_08675 [bacterium]